MNDRRADGSVVRASEAWICAYFVFLGAMDPEPKKPRDTNDRSGGSRVLVEGSVLISTVGVTIVLEGTASIHSDGIDVRVLAIYRRWDLSMSVCSMFFFMI